MFVADYECDWWKGLIGPFPSKEAANEYCESLNADWSSWHVTELVPPVYRAQ
ncbi:hypothetical protein SEA_BILLNYE_65 [Streptomyces phage BillNye]|uniref:Uncharacterized protein n=1 Tax=Streptomyces phage BillNye TaxID=2079426 RepID=A0A2L1IVS8_9CAUD|nr:hypothetical protein FDJ30_gp166 [Streptomyces phage BillNye]AVD99267.1 hypothetical protein SEA_BILLNYE_65 [Streptomyces phage BillNye]